MSYATSIDSLLSTMTPPVDTSYQNIFQTFSLADNSSVYSPILFGGGGSAIDFTCIGHRTSPSSSFYCKLTAITPRHAITSEHNAVGFDIGNQVTWIAANGTRATRTISAYASFVSSATATDAFRIVYLDSDLPASINKAPLFADRSTYMIGQPVIKTDQFHLALVANISQDDGTGMMFTDPLTGNRHAFYGDWIGNDSGSPAFAVLDRQLIYLTSAVGGGGGSGPNCSTRIDSIMHAIQLLNDSNGGNYLPALQGGMTCPSKVSTGISVGI